MPKNQGKIRRQSLDEEKKKQFLSVPLSPQRGQLSPIKKHATVGNHNCSPKMRLIIVPGSLEVDESSSYLEV